MPNTFTLIASSTVGSGGAANIDFTSIPATYTDLCLKISARSDRNVFDWTNIKIQFNNSTSGYTYRQIVGDGSSASGVNNTNDGEGSTGIIVFSMGQANSGANIFGNCEVYIPNYAGSTNKSVSSDGVMDKNTTNSGMALTAGLWSNTAAITSIKLIPQISGSTFNFVQHSTAYLYGIVSS